MKREVFILVCLLLAMAYAEAWWVRVSKQNERIIGELGDISRAVKSRETSGGYITIGNERIEKALDAISKQKSEVYVGTGAIETKLESVVDELRELNGTLDMLTH